jgi:MFS family permease
MTRNLLRENKIFLKVWLANLSAEFGGIFYEVMIVWYLVVTRDSALIAGGIAIASLAGRLLGSALISEKVDKLDTKKVMAAIDFVRTLGLLTVTVFVHFFTQNLPGLYGISFVMALLSGSYTVVRRKSIAEIVEKRNLVEANALEGVSASVVRILSWGLGAILINDFGLRFALGLNTIFSLASLILILGAKWISFKSETKSETLEKGEGVQFLQGVKIISKHPNIKRIISAEIIYYLMMGFFWVAFPLKAGELGGGAVYALHGSIAGVGWLVASLYLGSKKNSTRIGLMYTVGIIVYSIGNVFVAWAGLPWIFLLGVFISGLGCAYWETGKPTFFHTTIPTSDIGKVFSVFESVVNITSIPAFILGGILVDRFSATYIMVIIAILQLIPLAMIITKKSLINFRVESHI